MSATIPTFRLIVKRTTCIGKWRDRRRGQHSPRHEEVGCVNSADMRFFSVYGSQDESKKQYVNMTCQFLWQMRRGKSKIIYGKRERPAASCISVM